jgi:hypothetical protein
MAEGATLIVAPGEEAFFRKVSAVRFSADPDTLTRNPREPEFEPLQNGKRGDLLNRPSNGGTPTTIAEFRKAVEDLKLKAN